MDGYKKKKINLWRGNYYSDTRIAVIHWLERELPKIEGDVLNVAAGGWPVPRQLLTNPKLGKYFTFDKKHYGDSKNPVKLYGDVHSMPKEWSCRWDCVICNQAIECFRDPHKAVREMHRVLKTDGVCLIDAPFNHAAFGFGSTPESLKKKFPVDDFWRITAQGLKLLFTEAGFEEKNVVIETSGPNTWDPYCIMGRATK